MVVMELCLASRFSLYLCVSVYTECLYTHMIMLVCTSLFRKKNPDFPVSFLLCCVFWKCYSPFLLLGQSKTCSQYLMITINVFKH